jgi:hypothetical protein
VVIFFEPIQDIGGIQVIHEEKLWREKENGKKEKVKEIISM